MDYPLAYNITLVKAHQFHDKLTALLKDTGLIVSKASVKQNTWDVDLPNFYKQLGAIYYGGDERKVIKYQAVAYVELRFDKDHLRDLGILEKVRKIEVKRLETDHFFKIQFHEKDFVLAPRICSSLKPIISSI